MSFLQFVILTSELHELHRVILIRKTSEYVRNCLSTRKWILSVKIWQQFRKHHRNMGEKTAPTSQPQLEWVYGYRGHQSRNNLFITGGKDIVYNPRENKQRFFLGHDDDILWFLISLYNSWFLLDYIQNKFFI